MADVSHLERMGRKLKCPICLSLLNSAVSLTCNHVFCNSCIVKSMKLDSNCPVCKVPYRRREIRPAPHMDNLVSVYKSMEVASGTNIFVTQNAPCTKLSDDKQVEGDQSCAVHETGEASDVRAETERSFKRKRSKTLFEDNINFSGPDTAKPSFPTKKRVQVPQNPLSETPLRPENFKGGFGDGTNKPNISSTGNEKLDKQEQKEPVLSPFFWLRENEDVEQLSQETAGDNGMESPLLNAPCFSDIKDSDDEMPSALMEKGKVKDRSYISDCFDNEIFEWTQRPCSPELCPSPEKMQVPDTEEYDETQEKESCGVLHDVFTCDHNSYTCGVNVDGPSETKKTKRRGRKANDQKKLTKTHADHDFKDLIASNIVADSFEEPIKDVNDDVPYLENSIDEATKKFGSDKSLIQSKHERTPYSLRTSKGSTKKPAASSKKDCGDKADERAGSEDQKDRLVNAENQDQNCPMDILTENVQTTNRSRNELQNSELVMSPSATVQDCNVSDSGRRTRKHTKESKSSMNRKCNAASKQSKELKVSTIDVSVTKLSDSEGPTETSAAKETQSLKSPLTIGSVLRKCDALVNKIQCAFCHSAGDSEASGEMVHYLNGRPVQADCGGEHIIHSHRNCTEWAPNVYFEDEIAINLESELARSRRIKCALCGEKGAALGCYEKSCRRSFHYPCVKLVPQCQWDSDNFVMLCPTHASSKFPNEFFKPPRREKKKSIPKGPSHGPQARAAYAQDNIISWRRNSHGSAAKLVLCCSALTVAERDKVSEFQRLSRVSVLKKWDSSVTHVIASVDENGACKRTLKVLMGILDGKWILRIEWIQACLEAMTPVEEEPYEINIDTYGVKDGPRLGRIRFLNKKPRLFDGLKFYFAGEFALSYKGYLQDLVVAAGGTVLHRKPILHDQEAQSSAFTFIVYSREPPENCDANKKHLIVNQRRVDAEALSCSTGVQVASNLWILNSIAACKLQNLAE